MATLRTLVAACLMTVAPAVTFADCSAESAAVPASQRKAFVLRSAC